MTIRTALALLILLAGCGGSSGGAGPAPGNGQPPPGPPPAEDPVGDFADTLAGLPLDEYYAVSFAGLLARSPENVVWQALESIVPLDGNELDDVSLDYRRDTFAMYRVALEALQTFDRASLSPSAQVDFDVYGWHLRDMIDREPFLLYGFPATYMGFSVPRSTERFFTDIHPLATVEDAENYIERLSIVDRKFAQLEEHLLAQRDTAGVVEPALTMRVAIDLMAPLADTVAVDHRYYTAFSDKIEQIPGLNDSSRITLRNRAQAAVQNSVIPAYRSLRATLRQLLTGAPSTIGVGQYPLGTEYYAYALSRHTTTGLTAAEIHQLGLDELDRIHAEMHQRFDQLGYPQNESLAELYARVASDGGIVPAADVLPTYEGLVAFAESNIGTAFDLVPSAPVVVRPDPVGGFYIAPSFDGSRPGAFYAGTDFDQPYFPMPSLAFHEAVPGHHTQIAISMEQDVPTFRKVLRSTAFTEGWALYAERLAWELGWYDNDIFGDLGRLQYEALRAARLVIDTGIHGLGWSFDEAAAFNQANVGVSLASSQGAAARYSVWPGQATAYMVGMLTILAERQRAMDTLGARFDLVAFHRTLLENGAVPLPLLETIVDGYIEAALAAN